MLFLSIYHTHSSKKNKKNIFEVKLDSSEFCDLNQLNCFALKHTHSSKKTKTKQKGLQWDFI